MTAAADNLINLLVVKLNDRAFDQPPTRHLLHPPLLQQKTTPCSPPRTQKSGKRVWRRAVVFWSRVSVFDVFLRAVTAV